MVECGIGNKVANVLADGSISYERPVEEGDAPVGPQDQVVGPEVQVAQHPRERGHDLVEAMPRCVKRHGCLTQLAGKVVLDQGLVPGLVAVE
jgi:hypothetical protein